MIDLVSFEAGAEAMREQLIDKFESLKRSSPTIGCGTAIATVRGTPTPIVATDVTAVYNPGDDAPNGPRDLLDADISEDDITQETEGGTEGEEGPRVAYDDASGDFYDTATGEVIEDTDDEDGR